MCTLCTANSCKCSATPGRPMIGLLACSQRRIKLLFSRLFYTKWVVPCTSLFFFSLVFKEIRETYAQLSKQSCLRCMVPRCSAPWNPAFLAFISHCTVSSMTPVPCDASLCHTRSLTVNWLTLNHCACPRMDPFHFPLFPHFHNDLRLLYHLHSLLRAWNICYAMYLPMWTPPSTPCTVTATAHSAVPLPPYSLYSGPPGIYRITQLIILVIWITVLQS